MYQVIRYHIFNKQVKTIKTYETMTQAINEMEKRQIQAIKTNQYQYKFNIKKESEK